MTHSAPSARAAAADELWPEVEAQLPFLDYLPEPARLHARELALAILRDKTFHGANGLDLTDPMMLSIALQAALPVLRAGAGAYRDWGGIVVYPGEIVVPRSEVDDSGVVHEYAQTVLGEAWSHGPVLLAWDVDAGHSLGQDAGAQVVVHEFAHKLDMASGEANGCPLLPDDISQATWAAAFAPAYTHFSAAVDAWLARFGDTEDPPHPADLEPDNPLWALDPYAAEDPAEFFAVAAETFFVTPDLLQDAFPAVYAVLARYFGVDCAARARHFVASGQHV